MIAVRIYEYGGPDVLKYEDNVPEPTPGPDMVQIESVATSVNPIDWKIRSGARKNDFPVTFPAILGKDVSGIVRAVGSNVRTFKPGDRVLAMTDATYAQYVTVPGDIVTHLPDGVDPIDAAGLPLVALTGEQLVRLATRATTSQTILVIGALGSVGRAAVHTAKKLGANVIAGVRTRQLSEAERLDVAGVIALDDEAAIERMEAVDGIADTVGGEVAAKFIRKVKAGGRFGYAAMLPPDVVANNSTIEFSRILARPDASKLREFADDIRDGTFVLPISHRLPLSETATAHAQLEKGGGGKIVLTI